MASRTKPWLRMSRNWSGENIGAMVTISRSDSLRTGTIRHPGQRSLAHASGPCRTPAVPAARRAVHTARRRSLPHAGRLTVTKKIRDQRLDRQDAIYGAPTGSGAVIPSRSAGLSRHGRPPRCPGPASFFPSCPGTAGAFPGGARRGIRAHAGPGSDATAAPEWRWSHA